MSAEELHILQHSLGVDKYGRGEQYRNHFVTGPGTIDWQNCQSLCGQGLMRDSGPAVMCGGSHLFFVTEAGKTRMAAESQAEPKLSRGRKRYSEWLKVADAVGSFGDYLKHHAK